MNAEKWDAKLKKWGKCQLDITFVLLASSLFSTLYHDYPRAFCVITVMLYSQERILGWPAYPLLRLDQKVSSWLAEHDVIRGHLLSLASTP